jgi:hypothetical protein
VNIGVPEFADLPDKGSDSALQPQPAAKARRHHLVHAGIHRGAVLPAPPVPY